MIEIINRQRKVKLDAEPFQTFAEKAAGCIVQARGKSFSAAFVSDRRMIDFNRRFRVKPQTTDVLSFPFEPDDFDPANKDYLGDIIISAEQAARQAAENKLTLEREIEQLLLHGILHLCGYDHETDNGQMNALELELRDKLGIS